MFEALVITLREGVEGALVLAIALALLRRRGLDHLRGALFAGTAVALILSAGLAWAVTRITYNQELAEGVAMLIGAALVLSLVVWIWRSAPHMKQEVERGIDYAAARGGGTVGVFLFAFGMVFREGAETAIFLSAAAFSSQGLALWLGAGFGLVLATVFGVLVVRGSVKIPLRPFFTLTSAVLLLIAIQLIVGGLHELSEAEVLPASRREMALIGPLVKNELLLFTLTVALVSIWLLRRTATPVSAEATGPEARLARASRQGEERRRRWTAGVTLAVLGVLITAFARGARTPGRAPATPVPIENGVLRTAAAPLEDERIHFYEVTTTAGPVRFFAVKVNQRVQVCFDACEICGDMGYYEEGLSVVCRNCTSPIARATLGRSGGCNPIPLPHQDVGGQIVIQAADVETMIPLLRGK